MEDASSNLGLYIQASSNPLIVPPRLTVNQGPPGQLSYLVGQFIRLADGRLNEVKHSRHRTAETLGNMHMPKDER